MSTKGFSHLGLSTLDLDKTRDFYENVLGFKTVVVQASRLLPEAAETAAPQLFL